MKAFVIIIITDDVSAGKKEVHWTAMSGKENII